MKQINFRHRLYSSVLAIALTATLTLVSCNKEDNISPVDSVPMAVENYALLDYQDTMHLAYAMRTDLYDCNNIVFQLSDGGCLILYSQKHLDLLMDFDSANLVSPDDFTAHQEGIVAMIVSDLSPTGICISRGQMVLHRTGDLYAIQILGATENGLGFRCQYTGLVHDLTTLSNQGRLTMGQESLTFHLGMLCLEGDRHTYHLIGSNPHVECVISSTTDIIGKTLPISDDALIIENGTAVGMTASLPNGLQAKASSGTLQCSCYGNIYSLVINADTDHGSATVLFTGPMYTAE